MEIFQLTRMHSRKCQASAQRNPKTLSHKFVFYCQVLNGKKKKRTKERKEKDKKKKKQYHVHNFSCIW